MVSGNIKGTKVGNKYTNNFPTIRRSKSLPAKSLTNIQTDCSMKIKISIVKILRKVFKKVLSMYLSSIFTNYCYKF